MLGHTRWASVGIISQANAHPLNSDELGRVEADAAPYVVPTAVLNGDVDNFADLKATEALRIPAEITTDAKVIPTLTSRAPARRVTTWSRPSGAASTPSRDRWPSAPAPPPTPDDLLLALRGSGQALYVGLAEDAFLVASEPYGVVEETDRYLRMDGETPADADQPERHPGQIVRLRGAAAGTVEGIERVRLRRHAAAGGGRRAGRAPQITTRDIDRGDFPHFLLKEISEAPASFRKTLRGKRGRARRPPAGAAGRRHAAAAAARRPAPTGPSAGSWSSARAPPRWPARAWPQRSRAALRR